MTRQLWGSSWMRGFGVAALVSILAACGGSPEDETLSTETSVSELTGTPAQGFFAYNQKIRVDERGFISLGSPDSLGGKVLEGSPQLTGRFDVNEAGMIAGVFKVTTGKVQILFPYNEHATILDGEVVITDASGQTRTFRRGDSYMVRQGQTVLWHVKGRHVIKTAFMYTQPQ